MKPTYAWILFAFEPNGEVPHIWNPEPGVALSEKDALEAVRRLNKGGHAAWYIKRSVYHWPKVSRASKGTA